MTSNAGLTELYGGHVPVVEHVRKSPHLGKPAEAHSVVAVYRLNGDSPRIWTMEGSEKMWLKDLNLPQSNLNNSRILTNVYNANVTAMFSKTSSDRILQHAHTLVDHLVTYRKASLLEDATQRLIIFRIPQAAPASPFSICIRSTSRRFLRTPHDGGIRAKLAPTSRCIIGALVPSKIVDTEGQLLNAMQEGSGVLQNITDVFGPLMKDFHIFFFWEQEQTSMGITQDYVRRCSSLKRDLNADVWQVVEESSVAPTLDDTERAGLPYDQRNMCKFENRTSFGYRLVVAALMRYSTEALQGLSRRVLAEQGMAILEPTAPTTFESSSYGATRVPVADIVAVHCVLESELEAWTDIKSLNVRYIQAAYNLHMPWLRKFAREASTRIFLHKKSVRLEHLRSGSMSTHSIIFLETPHIGVRKEILVSWHHNRPALSQFFLNLPRGSEMLQEITDQFAPLMKLFAVYELWEQRKTKAGDVNSVVVEDDSAAPTWDDTESCGIFATHDYMIKFSDAHDHGH
ncbi:MAG: hypothetical protein ASARMPREDX12_004838 [Alectoria sarmentosa]|nr:MAG: hypothetical protein ASARMPREDX12_004838 [Alectoria sarmentosa]